MTARSWADLTEAERAHERERNRLDWEWTEARDATEGDERDWRRWSALFRSRGLPSGYGLDWPGCDALEGFQDRVKAHDASLDRRGGYWHYATARYGDHPGRLRVSKSGAERLVTRYGGRASFTPSGEPVRLQGGALYGEDIPPMGQAGEWWSDVCRFTLSRTARDTARQIARLCGEDSEVTTSWRSLADAVGKVDRAGRGRAYVEGGVGVLRRMGWLGVETVGRGRKARTTFRLLPGERIGSHEGWSEDWDAPMHDAIVKFD